MRERAAKNSLGGYQSSYKHEKLRTEEPDEEKLSIADDDQRQVRQLQQDLDEARLEIKQMSEEIRRLR